MCIFQLLTRFTCIKFSSLLEGIFLSPIVLIVFKKNGPIRIQYLSVCQEGSDGRYHYCDVTYLELRRSERPYYFNDLDSNVLFTERKLTLLKQ